MGEHGRRKEHFVAWRSRQRPMLTGITVDRPRLTFRQLRREHDLADGAAVCREGAAPVPRPDRVLPPRRRRSRPGRGGGPGARRMVRMAVPPPGRHQHRPQGGRFVDGRRNRGAMLVELPVRETEALNTGPRRQGAHGLGQLGAPSCGQLGGSVGRRARMRCFPVGRDDHRDVASCGRHRRDQASGAECFVVGMGGQYHQGAARSGRRGQVRQSGDQLIPVTRIEPRIQVAERNRHRRRLLVPIVVSPIDSGIRRSPSVLLVPCWFLHRVLAKPRTSSRAGLFHSRPGYIAEGLVPRPIRCDQPRATDLGCTRGQGVRRWGSGPAAMWTSATGADR